MKPNFAGIRAEVKGTRYEKAGHSVFSLDTLNIDPKVDALAPASVLKACWR